MKSEQNEDHCFIFYWNAYGCGVGLITEMENKLEHFFWCRPSWNLSESIVREGGLVFIIFCTSVLFERVGKWRKEAVYFRADRVYYVLYAIVDWIFPDP